MSQQSQRKGKRIKQEGEERRRRPARHSERDQPTAAMPEGTAAPSLAGGDLAALLSDSQLDNPSNVSVRAEAVTGVQRDMGNTYAQQLLQPKLTIGQPDDAYERQADRVAEEVVRTPDPAIQRQEEREEEELLQPKRVGERISPLVQRQEEEEEGLQPRLLNGESDPTLQLQAEEEEEEEEALQMVPIADQITSAVQRQEEEEEELVLPQRTEDQAFQVDPEVEGRIAALRGGGQPLSESERSYFEPRFGYDFENVRIHTGAEAAATAGELHAQAYTVGKDVVFGAGRYAPETTEGRQLLAHELTHVVQQTGPARLSAQRGDTTEQEEVSPPSGPYTGRRRRNDKLDWFEHNQNLFGGPIFRRYVENKALWAPLQGAVEAYWKAGGSQSGITLDKPELKQAAWALLEGTATPREIAIVRENVERGGDRALVEAVFIEHAQHYPEANRRAHRDWWKSNFRHFHEWAAVTFNLVSPPYAYHAKSAGH